MSAEILREAARVLRDTAGEADEGPWEYDGQVITSHWPGGAVAQTGLFENGTYIATMHPPVALALADWLDAEARHFDDDLAQVKCEYGDHVTEMYAGGWFVDHPALAVAKAVLG